MEPNQQENLSQQPMAQPKSSFPKTLFILLGIIAILGLIGGAYYLGAKQNSLISVDNGKMSTLPTKVPSPTSDPTAGWQTYTSINGFSVKYPSSWVLTVLTDQQKNQRDYYGYLVNRLGIEAIVSSSDNKLGYTQQLKISVYNNPDMVSLSQFIAQHTYNATNMLPADDEKRAPNFNYGSFVQNSSPLGITQEWVINRRVPDAHAGSEEALIAHGKQVIDLDLNSRDDGLMDTFISTLKFTQ